MASPSKPKPPKPVFDRNGGSNDDTRVHYGPYNSPTFKDVAICGYPFQKRLRGTDRAVTWDLDAPWPVSCVDCLMKRPPKWRIPKWGTGFPGRRKVRV